MPWSRVLFGAIAILVGMGSGCRQGAASPVAQMPRVPVHEVFVLPPAYTGPFIAIYGEMRGADPAWRGDTAIFQVPASGILRVRYSEPPSTTLSSHVYADQPGQPLRNYPTCADMWIHVPDKRKAVCWLDFTVGTTTDAEHIVAVIASRSNLPRMYEQTTSTYDFVVLGGKGLGKRRWVEPTDPSRRITE